MITTIVGFAISVVFLFLMLSAACSAIQEIAANLMKWRAVTLEKGLAGLFLSEQFKDKLYGMPLVKALCSPDTRGNLTRRPSYIPSASLALAVLDLANQEEMDLTAAAASHATFRETESLLQSIVRGAATVEEQKLRIEGWYNDSMDRVSGWYKRKAHAWIWVFSIILCLALNADSITLGQKFWNDQKLPGVPVGWCFAKNPADTVATCWPDLSAPLSLNHGIPVSPKDPRRVDGRFVGWWFWKVIGIALTALAVSQGAPFWFDLLQKVVNLRLAGARPATTPPSS